MKKWQLKITRFILLKIIGLKCIEKLISILSTGVNLSILDIAHREMGIMKGHLFSLSGEDYFIKNILSKKLPKSNSVIFDIGANIGEYSIALSKTINLPIYSIEPNMKAFDILAINTKEYRNINPVKIGMSKIKEKRNIYFPKNEPISEQASIYSDAFMGSQMEEIICEFDTIDNFCDKKNINHIFLLKIDTEGHEYEVLQGANAMIIANKIDFIQFEFNYMNIYSRVFLKDFYDLLPMYNFYRLDQNKIIPILNYSPENEIFRFQNIVAISKNMGMQIE